MLMTNDIIDKYNMVGGLLMVAACITAIITDLVGPTKVFYQKLPWCNGVYYTRGGKKRFFGRYLFYYIKGGPLKMYLYDSLLASVVLSWSDRTETRTELEAVSTHLQSVSGCRLWGCPVPVLPSYKVTWSVMVLQYSSLLHYCFPSASGCDLG